MNFSIIVCDCPFSFSDKLLMEDTARGASSNYNTMSIAQLKQVKVKDLSDPNGALLAFWVPSSLLSEGLDIMKTWGFTQKQTYIWVKTKSDPLKDIKSALLKKFKANPFKSSKELRDNVKDLSNKLNLLAFGMGRLFRQTHEICLIGTSNNNIYKKLENKSQRSVSFAENLKHSKKPECLQDSLDIMFPNKSINKIELFARRQRKDWVCIGNEAPMTMGEDINLSINKLLKISNEDYNEIILNQKFEKWRDIDLI